MTDHIEGPEHTQCDDNGFIIGLAYGLFVARFPPPSYCLVKARQPASYPSATPGLPVLRLELAKKY